MTSSTNPSTWEIAPEMLIQPFHIMQSCLCEVQDSLSCSLTNLPFYALSVLGIIMVPRGQAHIRGSKPSIVSSGWFWFLFSPRLCLACPRLATSLLWSQGHAWTSDFPASISHYYKVVPPCLGHTVLGMAPQLHTHWVSTIPVEPQPQPTGVIFSPHHIVSNWAGMYPPCLSFLVIVTQCRADSGTINTL